MKNYFLGVITAALAALLAYIGQSYFDKYTKANNLFLEHTTYRPSLVLEKNDLERWFKADSLPEEQKRLFDRINVTLVEIENTGNEPLINQQIRILPSIRDDEWPGIIGFQNQFVPGSDEAGTRMEIRDKSLFITYSLFNRDDTHMFWVISDRFTEPELLVRRPGLKVQGWTVGVSTWNEEDGWSFGDIFVYLLGALMFFILGLFVLERSMTKALAKRGHNLKDILAAPPVQDKEDA